MSTVQDRPRRTGRSAGSAEKVPAPRRGSSDGAARSSRSRRVVLALAVGGLVAAGGAGMVVLGDHPNGAPGSAPGLDTAPLTLPAQVAGLPPLAENDPTAAETWRAKAKAAAGGATLAARTYGPGGLGRSLRVVAARTDLTEKLELAWPADDGQAVGDVRCTNDVRFNAQSAPAIRPTLTLCWRTSATLSVYALLIDPRAKTAVPTTDAVAAVETVWSSASKA